MDIKLIIVEGLNGSGKSSTAQFIAIKLLRQGIPCQLVLESQEDHPLFLQSPLPDPLSALKQLLSRWKSYVIQVQQSDLCRIEYPHQSERKSPYNVVILESCFFQYIIGTMLQMDINKQCIHQFINQIKETITPLNPHLILLRETDIPTTIKKAYSQRGELWKNIKIHENNQTLYSRKRAIKGFDALIQFKQEFADLSSSIFEELDIKKFSIDKSTGDWNSHYKEIFQFLSIPFSHPLNSGTHQSDDSLKKYQGAYTCYLQGKPHEFFIHSENGSLYVRDLPFFKEISQKRLTRFQKHTFWLETWPYEFKFQENEEGVIYSIKMQSLNPSTFSSKISPTIFIKKPIP